MGLVSSLNHARKIGSEFEGYILLTASGEPRSAQEALAHALTQNGIPAIARGYSKESLPSHIKVAVEYDASIQPEQKYRGIRWAQIEVKTAILNLQEWEAIVPPMLHLLRYAGLRVNHSTGHHLTLSFDEVEEVANVRSLWNLYHRYQDVLFSLVAPSRRGNTYCRPLPHEPKLLHGANSKRALRQRLAGYDRYYFLNTTNLLGNAPRIEIRNHQGTLDPAKARAWLHLNMAMVDHAVRRSCQAAPAPLANSRQTIDALFTTVGLKPNTRVYAKVDPVLRNAAKSLLKTWKKFNREFTGNAGPASEEINF